MAQWSSKSYYDFMTPLDLHNGSTCSIVSGLPLIGVSKFILDNTCLRQKPLNCNQRLCSLEHYREQLLLSYSELVSTVCQMVRASQSMRCFLKGSLDSPIVEFCSQPGNSDDCGDGRGVPVFSYLSVTYFESLAQELTQMFVLELNLKRLLVAALCCITCDDGINTQANVLNWSNELFPGEFENMGSIGLLNEESCLPIPPCIQGRENGDTNMERLSQHPEREVMQVYLTVWLAEVNINTRRVDEIIAMVEEEMQLKLGSS
ncbi:uncharacterized protein LOC18428013 isoform X3 [Amborella trichopoda]|uniref:uncharacterized protein LOC18428013 isoform X3 n=1 Tax=Amborella trichopoda TaxID=13333 RepID=UPI0009BE9A73|nr:uncharacterized protein LOC18428013 isoform X3 [Amborella trichopoda]|eukprot:XP_020519129.1 uncharacterized protein LOC18428013 isoform X3 [Amborella trichopoda]